MTQGAGEALGSVLRIIYVHEDTYVHKGEMY